MKIPTSLIHEIQLLVDDFKNLKPLIDEDISKIDREFSATKSLIPEEEKTLEEAEEERELEESLGTLSTTFNKDLKLTEDERWPVDPITGRRVPLPNLTETRKRCDELFLSAQMRIIEKNGPCVPHLPIIEKRDEILDLIERNRVIVLSGDTGCGKSTQMPQYILDSYALKHQGTECNIIVTQPRRLAALSLAQTVAGYRGENVSVLNADFKKLFM